MRSLVFGCFACSLILVADVSSGDEAADNSFFESKVRPLLISKCFECHGPDKPKAGLQMDSREAILAGGESGPCAVSGKPEESLLMEVIGYRNSVQMPPKSKLSDTEIATLTEWVRRGLPWPNSKPTTSAPSTSTPASTDFTEEQKAFWAFQPVKQELPPIVANEARVRSAIDRFLMAELQSKGLSPSPAAPRQTLLRRVTLDLIGLPPTPAEVNAFLADESPDAFERVVDRLLASPHYGERWARHWLDVARYADSNGLDENLAYANAYRYRDYVVKAMNEDKPYDRFLTEQLAGDIIAFPGDTPSSSGPETDSFDALVATGFLCLGAKMLAEDDPVKMHMDIIDEQVDTIARTVMGMTMGCARCHDHKYDPLTMEDYYGLAGIFKSTQTMDTFTVVARWHERPLATPKQEKELDELRQLAATKKQAVEKQKADATEAILADAKKHASDYLLSATRDLQLAERLKSVAPRGNLANLNEIVGAILIEAEDYVRGNVNKDRDQYGKGIGVLVNRGETPNFAEYDIDIAKAGGYQFELRYAAASSRPVKVSINSELVKSDAAAKLTGSWEPETQTWFVECFVALKNGRNTIRLEQPQFFPHIDKLLLSPVESSGAMITPTLSETGASNDGYRVIPSLKQQWAKAIESAKTDPKSILTAWNQLVRDEKLTVDPANSDNGIARLLSDSPPTSLGDLAKRYETLFESAEQAWKELKASEAGKDALSLGDPVLEAARKLLSSTKGPFAAPSDIESAFPTDVKQALKTTRDDLADHEAKIPKYPETMAVVESKPENLKIHLRGSHLTLGKEVPRQLPRMLTRHTRHELNQGSGRLGLVQWLTSPDHPLTSRVIANRLWQWHFGQGLVRSPDNFGRLGERPSHPALLDWLASEFSGRDQDTSHSPRSWSLKSFHRRVLASAAYRQSTDLDDAAALADPENRLLWRFHRQRMEVEVIRDSLLALSGQLDETPKGTLLPTANRAYVTSTASVNPAIYNSNRRSIYLPVVRSALYEVFTAFDFADPSTLSGQRDQTTIAPQALFMMNSAFVLDRARALATGLLERSDLDRPEKIERLYELAYSRSATEHEIQRATDYLDRLVVAMKQPELATTEIDLRVWISLCRAVLSANEFVYIE